MNITELENNIFARYKNHCEMCSPGRALPDGCPDPKRFSNTDFRAVFVLKEAYGWEADTEYPRDLRRFARDGGAYKTWGNLARWSALVSEANFLNADLNASDHEQRAERLRSCAFVNLKKIPGGTRSNLKEIEVFANKHSELLKEQFALYRPHVTIACGTFGILRSLYGAEEKAKPNAENCFPFFTDKLLGVTFDFYHPQYVAYSPDEYLQWLRSNLAHHFPDRFRAPKRRLH